MFRGAALQRPLISIVICCYNRRQQRILIWLEAMVSFKLTRTELPRQVPAEYLDDALTFLRFGDRLDDYFSAHLEAPLAGVLK